MRVIEDAYNRFCSERFPLPKEDELRNIERSIGVALPPDYRDYLLKYNGGYFTEPEIVASCESCPRDGLVFLNGIHATDPTAELASEEDLATFDDNYPAQILPIGYTVMGNMILVVTHEEGRGSILLKKAFESGSYLLANGIEQFFGLLQERLQD